MVIERKWWIAGAVAAALLAGWVYSAKAGDLGGAGCCSDLEERVAELEAVSAKKGNRKVTLTISGQVSRALLYTDVDGATDHRFVDNSNSPSRITMSGSGKVGNVSAGFVFEIGLGNEPQIEDFISYPNSNDDLGLRRANVWIGGAAGKLTLGKASQATDEMDEISVANTAVASKLLSLGPVSAVYLFGFDLPFDGARKNLVRYDSPNMSGFMASASWSDDKAWDGAVRYAGEFGGFRMAGSLGYRQDDSIAFSIISLPVEYKTMLASASVMHMASGVFVNAMYADSDFSGTHLKAWHVQGGIEVKLTELGKTTFYGEFMQLDTGDKADIYGLGAVQKIDGLATDLFVAYRNYDSEVSTILAGMRVAF
jgi:predicted porin